MIWTKTRKTAKTLTAGACAVAAVAAGWAVIENAMQPAPLAALVPESVVMYAGGDARWLWNATEDVRGARAVADAMEGMEGELGISLEDDVLPWAGQVAVAMLAFDENKPQFAFLVEVRNPVQYYMTMTRLRTRMEREASRYWKGTGYQGVPLRYAYIGSGKDRMPVSTAWLKGWLVVGVGDGSTKRVIDAWGSRKKSLAENAVWADAIGRMPQDPMMTVGVNTGMIDDAYLAADMPASFARAQHAVTTMAFHEIEDGFRGVVFSNGTKPESRKLYGQFASMPSPNQDTLDRLPDGAFLEFAIADPGAWWNVVEPFFEMGFMSSVPNAERKEMQEFLDTAMARVDPLKRTISRFKDGLAIGLTYREGEGFGLALVGDAGTEASARAAAGELADYAKKYDAKIVEDAGPDTYRLDIPADDAPFPFEPSWRANGRYMMAGTHSLWLASGTGKDRAPIPAEAEGSQAISRGNFRFVEPAIRQYGPAEPKQGQPKPDDVLRIWRNTGLSEANWWSNTANRANGTQDGVFELRDWNWRGALRVLATELDDMAEKER